jgi:cell division protein FtsI (penicillin-binding protein 3)
VARATSKAKQLAKVGTQANGRGKQPGSHRWHDTGDPRRRAVGLLVVLLVLMAIICVQLVRLQVFASDRYVKYGEEQRLRGIELVGGRGQILDRNERELATVVPRRTIVADPRAVDDPAQTARDVARLVDVDHDVLYEALSRDAAFAYLARQVDDEAADAVEDADIPGIWTIDEPQRYNPADDLALSVIGQADRDGQGVSGIELAYEDNLAGANGWMTVERDRQGRTIPAGRRDITPAQRGEDLILTIDRSLQFQTEQALARHIESTESQAGTAIISDPRTGEVLALANLQADDKTGEASADEQNRALVSTYEPGSVLKIVAIAAALDTGAVEPDTELDIPPSIVRDGHTFAEERCTEPRRYTVSEILALSCNVGTILIADEVGADVLYDYLGDFGFGETTGLGFPNEASGIFPGLEDWTDSSLATISLGQGIAITPMHLLAALNTIANDGLYRPPQLVGEVVDAEGERLPVPAGDSRRVVATATAEATRDMMRGVVTDGGTGTQASVEGYDVAGKTGTARKPNPEDGGYNWQDGFHHVASFAGFLPADDPQVSVLVMLDEPAGDSAGSSAAPAFADVTRQAVHVLGIPPANL